MENSDDLKMTGDKKPYEIKEQEEKKFLRKSIGKKNGEQKAKELKTVIYVGPSVPNSIFISGKVYKKLPQHAKDFISKNPVIGKLVIDVEELAEFKGKVKVKGTRENMLYLQALKTINEGGLM